MLAAVSCRSAPVAAPPAAAPPAPPPPAVAGTIDSLLWSQTAEEARQIRRAVFAAAERALEAALADPAWSALGQGAEAASLPPAVIADVDETTLDNGPFEGRMAREGRSFDAAIWAAWVEAASAEPLPGALEFTRLASSRGVRVFYVTNRDAPFEAATRRNLRAAGFPLDEEVDVVLLRGEKPEWKSEKTGRFAEIARDHRVLLLIGDDLNDFLAGVRDASIAERRARADAVAERFGTSWFVLPNPLYGSWLRAALLGGESPETPEALLRRKLELLESFEGPAAVP